MQIKIKFLPPYRKAGEKGEYTLELEENEMTANDLIEYLSREWKDQLAFPLIDEKKGYHTAEIIVDGKHVSLEETIEDGAEVTIVPYICGG